MSKGFYCPNEGTFCGLLRACSACGYDPEQCPQLKNIRKYDNNVAEAFLASKDPIKINQVKLADYHWRYVQKVKYIKLNEGLSEQEAIAAAEAAWNKYPRYIK